MYTSASFSRVSCTIPGHDDAERAVAPPLSREVAANINNINERRTF